jgi:hypothetical protein
LLFKYKKSKRLNDSSESLGTLGLPIDDAPVVYATAQEFWDRRVNNTAMVNTMNNVRIDAETSLSGSHTTNRNWVRLVNTRGRLQPVSAVAHEIGHALTMHSLDRDFFSGPPCSAQHEFDQPMTCEGGAFHEAMANVFATAFQWKENAPDSEVTMGGFEMGLVSNDCYALSNQHRIEMCIGGAIWDIYDNPPFDDDAINASGANDSENVRGSDLVDILVQYADNSSNRGKDEGGEHGNNLWDWLENFDDLFNSLRDEALVIYGAHSLTGGEEPFPG